MTAFDYDEKMVEIRGWLAAFPAMSATESEQWTARLRENIRELLGPDLLDPSNLKYLVMGMMMLQSGLMSMMEQSGAEGMNRAQIALTALYSITNVDDLRQSPDMSGFQL